MDRCSALRKECKGSGARLRPILLHLSLIAAVYECERWTRYSNNMRSAMHSAYLEEFLLIRHVSLTPWGTRTGTVRPLPPKSASACVEESR